MAAMKARICVRMSKPHYGGNLVDGATMLSLFGDVATELCIRADGDEGLFRAYDSVEFLAPVYSGDFIEAVGEVVSFGKTSLKIKFAAYKYISPLSGPGFEPSAAKLHSEPILVCKASGTCVVPQNCRRMPLLDEHIGRPGPCIVTAAIVGAETTRTQTPYLPITPDEIGEEAARCAKAGATVIHLHVRDEAGNPSQDRERFRAAIAAIRSRCDVVVQTSTGGAVGMSIDERCGPLLISGRERAEMATLNVGTINFGDDIFVNRRLDTFGVAERIKAAGIIPEIEIYDLGHLDILGLVDERLGDVLDEVLERDVVGHGRILRAGSGAELEAARRGARLRWPRQHPTASRAGQKHQPELLRARVCLAATTTCPGGRACRSDLTRRSSSRACG